MCRASRSLLVTQKNFQEIKFISRRGDFITHFRLHAITIIEVRDNISSFNISSEDLFYAPRSKDRLGVCF